MPSIIVIYCRKKEKRTSTFCHSSKNLSYTLYGKDAWVVVDPATKPFVNWSVPADLRWKLFPGVQALAHTGTQDAYERIQAIVRHAHFFEPSMRGLLASGESSVLPLVARHAHRHYHKQGEYKRRHGKGPASPSDLIYRNLMSAIRAHGPETVKTTVRTLLQSGEEQDLVLACTMAARMIPAPETGDMLLKACGDTDSANVDHACVQALTVPAMQPERYQEYFTKLIKSCYPPSRIAGIDGLAACPKVNSFEAYSDIIKGGDSVPRDDWKPDGSWIWHPDTDSGMNMSAGKRFFRKQFEIPEGNIERAVITVTADNDFVLHVNGKKIGSNDNWMVVSLFVLREHLTGGHNIIAIEAGNGAPGPAGLIGTVRIVFDKANPLVIKTDSSWKSSSESTAEWQAIAFNDSDWSRARELGPYGCAPWGEFAGVKETDKVMMAALEQLMSAPVEQAQGQKIGTYLYKAMASNDPQIRNAAAALFKKLAAKRDYAEVARAWETILYSKDHQIRSLARQTIAAIASEEDLVKLARSDGYITDWQVLGSFIGGETIEKTPVYPPEAELDFSKTYEAERILVIPNKNNKIPPKREKRTRTIEWLKGNVNSVEGLLAVHHFISQPTKEVVAYAAATVTPKTPGEAIIKVDSLDGQSLWVNGELAVPKSYKGSANLYLWPYKWPWRHRLGSEAVRSDYNVTLKEGPNQILVKTLNTKWKFWDFRVRVLDEDGSPVEMEGAADGGM